ncbi:hypothetical protein GWK47_013229 [Chionoecetes opilio]|uniref:Uncharacterized protein n=1 Tax=Chionoecetes opilio TaxID=41210 RepID=A0A8J4XVQ7_CHIOP|nr:hypothetical protein GWK47_013229 [Chionoecetes opilio]
MFPFLKLPFPLVPDEELPSLGGLHTEIKEQAHAWSSTPHPDLKDTIKRGLVPEIRPRWATTRQRNNDAPVQACPHLRVHEGGRRPLSPVTWDEELEKTLHSWIHCTSRITCLLSPWTCFPHGAQKGRSWLDCSSGTTSCPPQRRRAAVRMGSDVMTAEAIESDGQELEIAGVPQG